MLIGSSNCSDASKVASSARSAGAAGLATSSKLSIPGDFSPQADHDLELRQACGREFARFGRVDLGRAGAQRGEVVVVLVAGAQDQRPAAGLFHRVFEFVHAVGGIDIDEDEPGERRAELRQHPLADVGRPDADAIALSSPSACNPIARSSERRRRSAYVQRTPWWRVTSAGRSGPSRTTRRRRRPIVSPLSGVGEAPWT